VAKLAASEMAQRVVDRAVQLHGGQGLMKGATASEILKLVIAKQILKQSR